MGRTCPMVEKEDDMKGKKRNLWVLCVGLAAAACIPAPVLAERIGLEPVMAKPVLQAGKKHLTYLQIDLRPFTIEQANRAPANVSIVIDRSGSMSGEKIRKAKEAALMAVSRLRSDDIVSIVAYNSTVEVLVPATKASDRQTIKRGINRLYASGATALFAGVSKGAQEVRKFKSPGRVNRVVLLSDGLANVGPSSPAELGALGSALGREGIGVSTIGLGLDYNEDLMTQLAMKSEGNHLFARNTSDLIRGFDMEFSVGLAVVAKDVVVEIKCAEGIRPVRVLNADADIVGSKVVVHLNQVYSGRNAKLLMELEIPAAEPGSSMKIADVGVSYLNMATKTKDVLSSKVAVQFSSDRNEILTSVNKSVMEEVYLQLANEKYKLAVSLRDQGRIDDARRILSGNVDLLNRKGKFYNSKRLKSFAEDNKESIKNLDGVKWKGERKRMRDLQQNIQQSNEAF